MYLENRTYDRIRFTITTNADNERVKQVQSRDTFNDASIQPVTEEELQKIDGVERHEHVEKFITSADIRGPDQYTDKPADEIDYDGKRWRVQTVDGGYDALLPHNAVIMVVKQE